MLNCLPGVVSRWVVAAEGGQVAPAPLVQVPLVGDGHQLAVQRRDLGELDGRAAVVRPELEVVAEPERTLAQHVVALLGSGVVVLVLPGAVPEGGLQPPLRAEVLPVAPAEDRLAVGAARAAAGSTRGCGSGGSGRRR